MKRRFDKSRIEMKLKPGDKVLILLTDKERAKYPVRKLAPRWSHPADIVTELTNGVTYVVRTAEKKEITVHVSHLLPITGTLWGKLFPPASEGCTKTARRAPTTASDDSDFVDEVVDWHIEWKESTPYRVTSAGIRPIPLREVQRQMQQVRTGGSPTIGAG